MDYSRMSRPRLIEIIGEMEKKLLHLDEISAHLDLYSAVVEQSSEAVAVTNLTGDYIYVNRSYERLRGHSWQELASKKIRDTYPEDERRKREEAYHVLMGKGTWTGELKFVRSDGAVIETLCTSVIIRNEAGRPVAVAGMFTDITALKNAEKELLKAKEEAERANGLKSHFLAGTSHEIRTPMNAVIGFTDLLLEDERDPRKREYLETIRQSGNLLMQLINDILDLSKMEAGKIELVSSPFSVREVLDSIMDIFRQTALKKNISLDLEVEGTVPPVLMGDSRRIRQVLINTAGNAVKFTESGGVTIRTSYEEGEMITTVTDTGIGIAPDKQEIIFFPFRQAEGNTSFHYGGTGLGLSISKGLAELMGGRITLESIPGRGSSFTVRIPAERAPHDAMKSESLPGEGTVDRPWAGDAVIEKKVLVAEDNAASRKLMKAYMDRMGIPHDFAEDGNMALEMLGSRSYGIVLLDIVMPGMDGVEVLQRIRRDDSLKNLYVIAVTAQAMKGDEEKYLAMGFNDYISKPVDRILLGAKIGKAVLFLRREGGN